MTELVKPPSSSLDSNWDSDWKNKPIIRQLTSDDLHALEWDGEYTHFRNVYQKVYQRMQRGLALMWGAELQHVGLIGQAFVQFRQTKLSKQTLKGKIAYIHSFRVKPRHRCLGIGSAIMDVIEEDLILRQYQTVTLNVSNTNISAHRFYSRRGYSILETEPGEWSYYDDKGILRKMHEPGWRLSKDLRQGK